MIAANDDTLGLAKARLALKILFLLTALLLIAAGAFVVASDAWAIARSKKAIHDFRKDHPCPTTGKAKGACPGYVIDHVKPLCAGGPDRPSNMQWQDIQSSKKKDRVEAQECRALRDKRDRTF